MQITFEKLGFTYQPGTPLAFTALKDVSFTIAEHSYTAIVGHTGSGKSTLIQHLNGLLKPTTGTVRIGGQVITSATSNKDLNKLRRKVGYVFQFPEAQLFEETVLKDIEFAPLNFGYSPKEARQIAIEQAQAVQLPTDVWEKSPFELSGGQIRRVAIAGILAMKPGVMVLDEPTAGLDPQGSREIMSLFQRLHQEQGLTIVLVTHNMNDVADYADHVVVLEKGTVVGDGQPREIFADPQWLTDHHLGLPQTTAFAYQLQQRGFVFTEGLPLTEKQLAHELAMMLKGGNNQ